MRRIKMLEFALRMERFVLHYVHDSLAVLTSCFLVRSKQLAPAAQSVPPTKLASIQAQSGGSGPGSHKDDAGSHKDGSGGSSPRSEGIFTSHFFPVPHVLTSLLLRFSTTLGKPSFHVWFAEWRSFSWEWPTCDMGWNQLGSGSGPFRPVRRCGQNSRRSGPEEPCEEPGLSQAVRILHLVSFLVC
jgi:hypothetical protein